MNISTITIPILLTSAAFLSTAVSAEKLRFSANGAPNDPQTIALHTMKRHIENKLPKFDIQVFDSATLVKQGQQTQALARGKVDVAYLTPTWIAKKLPEWDLLETPYLLKGPEHMCAVWQTDELKTMIQEVENKMNAVLIGVAYQGVRTLNLRKAKKISTPQDLDGFKFRVVPSPANIAMGKALGTNPTPVPFKELYLALQTGAVDGQDNPLTITYNNKFHEVTEQITLTNHKVLPMMPAVSKRLWDRLSEEERSVFKEAGNIAMNEFSNLVIEKEKTLIDVFKSKGIKITEPNREAFREYALDYFKHSDFASAWKPGMFEMIANLEIPSQCER